MFDQLSLDHPSRHVHPKALPNSWHAIHPDTFPHIAMQVVQAPGIGRNVGPSCGFFPIDALRTCSIGVIPIINGALRSERVTKENGVVVPARQAYSHWSRWARYSATRRTHSGGGRIPSLPPNAHHHPPEATSAEGKPLGTGRVNDVVRRLHKRSRLSIE